MDISTLALPLRKERHDSRLFTIRPSITSVNISYETAEARLNESGDISSPDDSVNTADSNGYAAKPNMGSRKGKSKGTAKPEEEDEKMPRREMLKSPTVSKLEDENHQHEFPRKPVNVSPPGSWNNPNGFPTDVFPTPSPKLSTSSSSSRLAPPSPTKESRSSRSASRSSFSLASMECQNFVASLKEPRYAKPLSADEIAWIFQDFYLKLRQELLGSENELLTLEEQQAREDVQRDIESILDRAEKAVTGGELHAKLFALGGNHDNYLQPRIDTIRENPELFAAFTSGLELKHNDSHGHSGHSHSHSHSHSSNDSHTTDSNTSGSHNDSNSNDKNRNDKNRNDKNRNDSSTNDSSTNDSNSHSSELLEEGVESGGSSVSSSNSVEINGVDLTLAINYLNRVNRETSPKAKLSAMIKAHRSIADALSSNRDADTVLPLFIYSLMKSSVRDWWQNFMFIQKFRRASELVGQSAYCLTNFEAAIHVVEQFQVNPSEFSLPVSLDISHLTKPLTNPRAPRNRSSSQSSRGSSSNSVLATASFSQRLGETLSSYRSMLATRKHTAVVDQRFLTADADSLTLADVRVLLREYKRLAEIVEPRKNH